jgi:hypothetical protein
VDTDAMMIAVRFALYLDLMLVFGLPLFCLYTFKVAEQRFGREVLSSTLASALSLAGVGLSVLGLLLLTASMSDVTIGQHNLDGPEPDGRRDGRQDPYRCPYRNSARHGPCSFKGPIAMVVAVRLGCNGPWLARVDWTWCGGRGRGG